MPSMKDPIVGAFPEQTDPRSPALTGQPSSVTGQQGMGAALSGNMPQGQQSAMAPASPPVGTAEVGGAPLSSNEANARQGGAGANLDLVKNRGTPKEYWKKNISNLGSKKALGLLGDAANGSSFKTGKFAREDPEELRRMGVRMNEAMGINDPESQDKAVEGLIFSPMQEQIQYEVSKGVMTEDEGVMRMAMTMAQVQGAADEDELAEILADARARIAMGKISEAAGAMLPALAGANAGAVSPAPEYPERSESGGAVRGAIPPPGESRGTDFETGIRSYSAEKPLLHRKYLEKKQRNQ